MIQCVKDINDTALEAVEVTLDATSEVWSPVLRRPHQDLPFDDRSRFRRQRRRGRWGRHGTAAVRLELLSQAVLFDLWRTTKHSLLLLDSRKESETIEYRIIML